MATAARKQDGPPVGGYQPLNYARVPAKSVIGAKSLIAGYLAMSGAAFYLYFQNYRRVHRDEIEVRSSMLAITPLLQAEHDREYLKQLRRNRDEETTLMANVKGWETGKYKGEPIFKTLPEDTLVKQSPLEYFAHGTYKHFQEFDEFLLWQ